MRAHCAFMCKISSFAELILRSYIVLKLDASSRHQLINTKKCSHFINSNLYMDN